MRYQIREMKISDIPFVIEGEKRIFKETLGYDMFYSELTLNPYAYYFILDIDNQVRGYIGLWIESERAEIVNFYIDKEYQQQGYGSMILEFAINLCTMSKVPTISLEVREHNFIAISLYEKYGFKFAYRREKYYKDLEDALVMIKEMR
ncbi:MAG: ribosomal protein S18-alanine N-acetyltransferase [Bacilli bacterium]|nr:ribosomal protein S18-alanine N-acetyltransferase [Bacilli bacterium]